MTDRDELYEIAQMIAHKPLYRGLRDKVAPRHTAIIVVDCRMISSPKTVTSPFLVARRRHGAQLTTQTYGQK